MEIKISKKPVKYEDAVKYLDERVDQVCQNKNQELIWFLEHKSVYTCGVSFNQKDILDKNVKIVKTNRGGKITWHGPGQLICYFVLDISKRKKDIRKFITVIENSIIEITISCNRNSRQFFTWFIVYKRYPTVTSPQ